MAKPKKIIKPLFLYDKNNKPIMVRLSIEDFNNFSNRLREFSESARKKAQKSKKS